MLTCLVARIVYQFKTYITCNFIGYPRSDLKCYTTKLLLIYLAYLLINPSRLLRSSAETLLWNPSYDLKTYCGRSLVVAASSLWISSSPVCQILYQLTLLKVVKKSQEKMIFESKSILPWVLTDGYWFLLFYCGFTAFEFSQFSHQILKSVKRSWTTGKQWGGSSCFITGTV